MNMTTLHPLRYLPVLVLMEWRSALGVLGSAAAARDVIRHIVRIRGLKTVRWLDEDNLRAVKLLGLYAW
jgi:hypothetical protein